MVKQKQEKGINSPAPPKRQKKLCSCAIWRCSGEASNLTARAEIKVSAKHFSQGLNDGYRGRSRKGCISKFSAQRNSGGFIAGGEDAKVTDFAKSRRQDVKHKAADKFEDIQLHNFLSVAVAVISPGKCNGMILYL